VALHPYTDDPEAEATGLQAAGLQAAEALGIDPAVMLKTLMVEVDGKPACCVIPADRQLSMKRVAAALPAQATRDPQLSSQVRPAPQDVGCVQSRTAAKT